ncbi:TPA: hypothetical protein ACX6SJ_003838 [Photobacterium damselae]
MNSTMIKLICLVLSTAIACLSATLTTKFMYTIGSDMGSPIVMGILGLLLDLAKCATPLFIFVLWAKRKYLSTIFAALLSITLSVVSFSASVAALESGVTASQQKSSEYQQIDAQIEDYRAQVTALRLLAKEQQEAHQITRSQKTLTQVPTLLAHIDDLVTKQSQLKSSGSVVTQYGMMISYIASAALELLSWLFVCVTNALYQPIQRTRTQSYAMEHRQKMDGDNELKVTSSAVVQHALTSTESTQLTAVDNDLLDAVEPHVTQCHAQMYLDIKNAVLAKSVKPSQRGISEEFKGVGRELMNQVLKDLKNVGFLKPYRKGYTYA